MERVRADESAGVVVKPIQLDLLSTILAAFVVLFTGRALIARSSFLARFSIPAPVVGGVIAAILIAVLDVAGGIKIGFDMALRDNLLLMFFTTAGHSENQAVTVHSGIR